MSELYRVKLDYNTTYYFDNMKDAWTAVTALHKGRHGKKLDYDGTLGRGYTIDIVHPKVPEWEALGYKEQEEHSHFSKWLETQS